MSWFTGLNADRHFFLLAVILYGVSMVYSVFLWRRGFRRDNHINYFLLLAAFAFHMTSMTRRGFSLQHCPVNNLYEATLFIGWTIVATYLVLGLLPRLRFLGAFASPILFGLGVFALNPLLDQAHGPKPEFTNGWVSLHAALVFISFGAFGLGSVAALMFLTQEHDLKFRKLRAILSLLPPIQRLEKVSVGLVTAGFVLLTAGLSLAPLLPEPRTTPGVPARFDPIVAWSAMVWLFYLVVLVMRWRGQGGRRFAWATLVSFGVIMLTFWGIMLLSPSHNS